MNNRNSKMKEGGREKEKRQLREGGAQLGKAIK
jgi:hypothetical protein